MTRNAFVLLLAAACMCGLLGGMMPCASAAPARVGLRGGRAAGAAVAAERSAAMRLGAVRMGRVLSGVVKRMKRGGKHKLSLPAMSMRKSDEDDSEHDGEDDDDDDDDSDEDDEESESEEESSSESESKSPSATPVAVAKTIRTAADGGGTGHIVDGVNVTHISYMIFKIIKANKIRSVVDMPCRNSLQWFPQLLQRIDFELGEFKYYCVDTDGDGVAAPMEDVRSHFSEAGNPEFLHMKPDAAHAIPRADLVFSWGGPQQWGVRNTWAFFTALRSVRPKFLMITNNPTVSNTNDHDGTLNLRKQPFHVS